MLVLPLIAAFDWAQHLDHLAQDHDAVVNDPNRMVFDTSSNPPVLVPLAQLQAKLLLADSDLRPFVTPQAIAIAQSNQPSSTTPTDCTQLLNILF